MRRYITYFPSRGDFHSNLINILQKDTNIILAWPRSHGKSTWCSLVYVLWCILFRKHEFILLISDSFTQSGSLLGAVIAELEQNELIINDFGAVAGFMPEKEAEKKKWTSKDITTLTGIRVMALGANSKFRGIRHREKRPSLVILDDIENDLNVNNQEQRIRLNSLFRRSIMNLGGAKTRFIIIGTILHFDSLLKNLIDSPPPGWYSKLYKAIENNQPIWPEVWSLDKLMQKKEEIGSLAFEQEFMNNPLDPSSQILHVINYYERIDPSMCDAFCYLDLASKEKEQNDWSAIVTVLKERKSGILYITDPKRIRGKIEDLLTFAIDYYKLHKHIVFGVESNNFQIWFSQLLQKRSLEEGVYLPIRPIEQIKDKITRAKSIAVYTENGTILFNKSYQDFNSEIEQFPKASHDDWVDSLVEGVKLAMSTSPDDSIGLGKPMDYGTNY